MLQLFLDHPGLLYVAATLLPLLAFLVLGLAGALRLAVRPRRPYEEPSALYRLLGGDTPGRTAAYVATGAIGLACVLSLIGFIWHARTFHDTEHQIHHLRHEIGELSHQRGKADELKEKEAELHRLEGLWSGRIEWAWLGGRDFHSKERIGIPGAADPERASAFYLGYRIDTLTTIMFLMVTFISTLIFIFSIGYMGEELQPVVEDHQVHTAGGHLRRRGRFGRFFLFLSLFCFSMLNLVLADNLFQVFISWELVGICSYLLIGFYYERPSASTAAIKAFVTNRIGDAGFIIGLLIIWTYLGTFNFQEIFQQIRSPLADTHGHALPLAAQVVRGDLMKPIAGGHEMEFTPHGSAVLLFPRDQSHFHGGPAYRDPTKKDNPDYFYEEQVYDSPQEHQYGYMPYWLLVAAGLGIFLGCVGKSAQFPLHVWLPDAMEGPTPVSALIHAATMVAAGVYLVGRAFPLFTPEARLVIAYTGGITLFLAATIAVVQTDIKKVLAYSTVSQLGYMMLALGVGGWVAGLFHLITHAFFKALLFLCSGSVIYGCHHEQDMLKMGGLYPKMRITAITMLVGVLTIAGIPLFSGWYSKDAILAQALGFARVHPEHGLLFLLPLVTAGITTFYMFRLWFLTFTGEPRDEHVYEHAHESPATMTVPLIILAFFSVTVAWGWPIWDAEASWLEHHKHHSQPASVYAEFGLLEYKDEAWPGFEERRSEAPTARPVHETERHWAHELHGLAGNLALGMVLLGIVFAALAYYYRVLDPAEAKEQFPAVHRFLWHKWYFDELYSAIVVRPALVVARWCRAFDTRVIDGVVDGSARVTVRVSRGEGRFDLGIIDGLVNLTADVIYAVGGWLRTVQTGYIRSYILFLVLAAVGIFLVLSYLVALATAGSP
ncbi:MAG TPA: NADH-quinone oxidoreductase subunit L [Gemmataceae bacterium]|nr:NADH-quinone oxidoreductase subunit L [Gemmataceae bacterium]